MLWRQGDIFIERVDAVPKQAALRTDTVIAEGESTGHQHRILDPLSARLFGFHTDMYLDVIGDFAQLVHDEHETIWLQRGVYRVWRQREYAPGRRRAESEGGWREQPDDDTRFVFD